MRPAFLGLLLANLLVFAWVQWLAPASTAATVESVPATSTGPAGVRGRDPSRIVLASERSQTGSAALPALVQMPATTAQAGMPVLAEEGSMAEPGSVTASAAEGSGSGASAVALAGGGATARVATELRRCVSIGPFIELDATARATAMLKQDGYEPRQRPANGAVNDGFMVMIGPLRREADQARVIGRLKRGGLDDAFALPRLDTGYAVSVGLFSEQRRAERRLLAVERMGLKAAVIERTRPGTVYWLDFDLKTPVGEPAALDPLIKTSDPSRSWQVAACPEPRSVG